MATYDKAIESYKKAVTTAASLAASAMLMRGVVNELVPYEVREFLFSGLGYLRSRMSSQHTVVIEETEGWASNQLYDAARTYLATRINTDMQRLRVSRVAEGKSLMFSMEEGEEMADVHDGAEFRWRLVCRDGAGAGSGSGVARGCRHHAYSRKQKSLGLLCSNFVALYDRGDVEVIGLDDAAKRLGVERRRIYDIVNVLESVGILVRRAKNRYTWLGFGGVPAALKELKERALREMSGSPVLLPMEDSSTANLSDDEDDEKLGDADEDAESEKLSQSVDNTSDKPDAPSCRLRSDHRKEKSLGLLTQNFVKLFLTMEVETISLDEAARLLLGEGHAESNMRTKVRRLYDIANVLSSLNLIEKTQQADTRKPAFRWLGQAKRKQENNVMVALSPSRKAMPNKRAFGTDLTNIDNKRGKLDSTAENKVKLVQGAGNIVKTFERQLGQGKRSDFVYGPFHPASAKKQETDDQTVKQQERKTIQDWENLAVSFRPQYQNQALTDLFGHYVEAWKSWYLDLTRETRS